MFERFEHRRIRTSGAEINLVTGGKGPPLLLLHGYPQTHVMWHKVAPILADHFTVVCADLRGYGDSSKPPSGARSANYAKRQMARDQAEIMSSLGFDRFHLCGHDRGGRVAHRLTLDHPERVLTLSVLDIAPTREMYANTTDAFARAYWHWFFLIQPHPFPERLIGADPEGYLKDKCGGFGEEAMGHFTPEAWSEYLRCFQDPETIRASCDDYRAAATIDIEHDDADGDRLVECPLLVLWGRQGVIEKCFDALAEWRKRAGDVRGTALDGGHYLAEERPEETAAELIRFHAGASA